MKRLERFPGLPFCQHEYAGEVLIRSVQGGLTSQLLSFNTFSSDNFTFEAEDWNYDRGDYINNPGVGDYFDLGEFGG